MNDNTDNENTRALPQASGPGVALNRHLTLAPAHLTRSTQVWLCGATPLAPLCSGLIVGVYDGGAFVTVPATIEAITDLHCPDDLKRVLKYARQAGCALVHFDTEAEFIADLPRYDRSSLSAHGWRLPVG